MKRPFGVYYLVVMSRRTIMVWMLGNFAVLSNLSMEKDRESKMIYNISCLGILEVSITHYSLANNVKTDCSLS